MPGDIIVIGAGGHAKVFVEAILLGGSFPRRGYASPVLSATF